MGLRAGAGNRYVECRNHSLQPQSFPTPTSVPDAKAATAVPTNENLKRTLSKFQLLSELLSNIIHYHQDDSRRLSIPN